MKKFNAEKELRKLKFKRNRSKYLKYSLVTISLGVAIVGGLFFSKSKYSNNGTMTPVSTKVAPFVARDYIIASYIDGVESATIPTKDAGYVIDHVDCDNDATGTWDNDKWGITVTNATQRTKCTVYFRSPSYTLKYYADNSEVASLPSSTDYNFVSASCDNGATISFDSSSWTVNVSNLTTDNTCSLYFKNNKFASLKDTILAAAGGTAAIEAKGTPSFSSVSTTDEGMYMAEDDYGKSYYYRGAVTNNNIIFGGFCWKIIRVNGNGSVRMIYNGTPTNNQCTTQTGEGTQIGTSAFNSSYNKNAYVGYMYGTAGSSTYAAEHANTNSSTIKQTIDTWYTNNLASYASYLSDTLFCNDRSIASSSGMWNSSDTALGYGTNYTYYGPYSRVASSTSGLKNQFSLKCANKNDRFTVSDTTTGNGALTYPVALISIDEIGFAGANGDSSNSSYYLYTGHNYWSLSPRGFDGYYTRGFYVFYNGGLNFNIVNGSFSARPVISLKADTLVSQDGTGESTNPYIVS